MPETWYEELTELTVLTKLTELVGRTRLTKLTGLNVEKFADFATRTLLVYLSYKKSKIYRLAYRLAIEVDEFCRSLPKHETYCLGSQLRRSSRSVVANYVEGYIRQGLLPADHRRFLVYCQGSCDETKLWLEMARDLHLIDAEEYQPLDSGYQRLSIFFVSQLRKKSLSSPKRSTDS